MEDSRLNRSILLDYYGELLTEKQRECFDLHYNEDLSLSEIAEQLGISRQGVWDNIRRAEAAESAMQEMEQKTGLIRKTQENRDALSKLKSRLDALCEMTGGEAGRLAQEAAAELARLIEE